MTGICEPAISIVTISYNQGRFLESTINSVLEQEYRNIEYIVVDPGSTDGSRDIIDRYADRISKVLLQPDNGPADGLNKGFGEAAGEIYGFLNADDLLTPTALPEVAHWFCNHPTMDIVSGHCWIIDEDGDRRRRLYSDRYSLRLATYGASILAQQSTFFRAAIYDKAGGFNANNRTCWDGELYVDMALAGGRFDVANRFWGEFRVHGKNISGLGAQNEQFGPDMERIAEKIKGRRLNAVDRLAAKGARYLRKALNPKDTLERIRHGAVFT